MEQAMTSSNDFPSAGMELRHLLVVSDCARSLAFYRDVLGATVVREIAGTLCFLTFASPSDPDRVSSELAIRVPDCSSAYEVLRSRGAEFLTPPVDWGYEVRAFFRDPDGHLLELSQSGQQKS